MVAESAVSGGFGRTGMDCSKEIYVYLGENTGNCTTALLCPPILSLPALAFHFQNGPGRIQVCGPRARSRAPDLGTPSAHGGSPPSQVTPRYLQKADGLAVLIAHGVGRPVGTNQLFRSLVRGRLGRRLRRWRLFVRSSFLIDRAKAGGRSMTGSVVHL